MIFSPRHRLSVFVLLLGSFLGSQALAAGIPARPRGAPTGTQFAQRLAQMSWSQREAAILAELASGNVPSFLRHPVPVKLAGGSSLVIVNVMPDYLAIGSDQDFLRVPMTPMTAQRIADAYGYMLPTQKIVDETYKQASVKLTPKPLPSGPQQTGAEYFVKHNGIIGRQYAMHGGALVAGHKKDIVLTNRLVKRPGQVAIYGWHRPNGKAIQPLSLVHGSTYADYSHGVRLVSSIAIVDGKPMPLADVLSSRRLAGCASYEGRLFAMRQPRTPGGAPAKVMMASHDVKSKSKSKSVAKGKAKILPSAKHVKNVRLAKYDDGAKSKAKAKAKATEAKTKTKPKVAAKAAAANRGSRKIKRI